MDNNKVLEVCNYMIDKINRILSSNKYEEREKKHIRSILSTYEEAKLKAINE